MRERIFLVSKEIDKELVVLGYVKSNTYPSTLANDQEAAKEAFGYTYLTISELPEKGYVKLAKVE